MAKGKIYTAPQLKRLEDFKLKRPSTSKKTTEDFARESRNRFFGDDEPIKNSPRYVQQQETEKYNERERISLADVYSMSDTGYDPDVTEKPFKKKEKFKFKDFMNKMAELEDGSATLSGKKKTNYNPIQDTSRATLSGKQNPQQRTVKRDFGNTIMTDDMDTFGKELKTGDSLGMKEVKGMGRAILDIPRNLAGGAIEGLDVVRKVMGSGEILLRKQ